MAQIVCPLVSAGDRAHLAAIVADRNRAQKHVARARIILESAERLTVAEIARRAGVGRLAVWRWQRRFAETGVDGLLRDPTRKPGKAPLADATVRRVVALTCSEPPGEATHWTGRAMAKTTSISLRSVQRIWAAHDLQPHRIRTFKRSRDPEFAAKLEDIVGLYLAPPKHAIVLSVDEKSQIQALDRTQPGLPLKPGKAGTMTHDYKRHGTTTLFAALNVLEGTVIGRCMQRHRHQEFIRFLNAVERAVPAGRVIHAILDNYAAHKHPNVFNWLARHPRWTFHFTPTSGSWLNAVETFFSALTPAQARELPLDRRPAGCHQSLRRSAQRRPQIVHLKPADQILAKANRLNASLHKVATMKGLFVTHPGIGHFQPMVPVARAFQEAGHHVAFASSLDFGPVVERAGFEAISAGLNWLEFEAATTFTEFRDASLAQLELWVFKGVFAGIAAEAMCSDLLNVCSRWKPDFLVCSDFEFSTHLVAERLGAPCMTVALGVYLSGLALNSIVGQKISALRATLGLMPDEDLSRLHGDLYFSWFPRSYQFPDASLPPTYQGLCAPEAKGVVGDQIAWITDLPARPTVLASLGTVFNKTREATEIFRAIIGGLYDEPINLIVTVGPGQDCARFGPTRAGLKILEYAPHADLLPHCHLVITQGGSMTTRLALSKGLPVIVVPLNGEDVFHAMRCSALGVGRVIKPSGLFEGYLGGRSFRQLGPSEIRSTVHELLRDPSYRQNAQRLGAEMASLPGPECAVEAMVRLCVPGTH